MQDLTKRQKRILSWIVHCHIETAVPVGSRNLVSGGGVKCSPATTRKEMACLEKSGFIRQPHTSAGRVPTDEGYRYYIRHLMKREELTQQECESIQRRISNAQGKVHLILEEASRILGKISNELSVVITPWMSFCIFDS